MIDAQTMTVLIADDMANIRKAIKSSLTVLGYGREFLQAENGQEALNLLQKEHVDIIILDCNMPIMAGTEVLSHVRADRSLRDIPVIMVTAEANKEIVAQAGESEIDAYLLKPITVRALQDKVTGVIDEVNNPTPMRLHLKLAKDLEDEGDIEGAIRETTLAMEANKRSSRPVRELGCLFLKKKDYAEAEKCFLKAAEMNYLDVIAVHNLGEIYLRQDKIEKAIQCLDRAMKISPHHLERCVNFGKALVKKGLIDRASKVFRKAFDVAKQDLKLVEDIADFCIVEGAKEYAASLLEHISESKPDRSDLLFKLGMVFVDLGAPKKAVHFLALAEQKDKDNVEIKIELAKAYLAINHPIRAETALRQVLKTDPGNEEAKELFKRC